MVLKKLLIFKEFYNKIIKFLIKKFFSDKINAKINYYYIQAPNERIKYYNCRYEVNEFFLNKYLRNG